MVADTKNTGWTFGLPWFLVGCLVMAMFFWQKGTTVQVDAAMTATADGFTLMTARGRDHRMATDAEVVYVVDHRRGILLAYGLRDALTAPNLELLQGGRIETLFERGRALFPAKPSSTAPAR
ncbi:MAG: hypothetical protein MK077_07425 [Phycisphaerales bacterium]|nr:hypothetical protein [Phycisphaerales bacterium]